MHNLQVDLSPFTDSYLVDIAAPVTEYDGNSIRHPQLQGCTNKELLRYLSSTGVVSKGKASSQTWVVHQTGEFDDTKDLGGSSGLAIRP